MKLLFLVSSSGGNLKFFHLALIQRKIQNLTLFVIADRECDAINYCITNGIHFQIIDYSIQSPGSLLKYIKQIAPDLVITTWNKIIDSKTLNYFPNKFINLHYSLLPAFKGMIGRNPIKEAQKLGCKYIGSTTHFVSEEVDGGEIISQAIIKNEGEFDYIVNQVFRSGCLQLLNSILLHSKKNLIPYHTNKNWQYSPDLIFDNKIFDEQFWQTLSKA